MAGCKQLPLCVKIVVNPRTNGVLLCYYDLFQLCISMINQLIATYMMQLKSVIFMSSPLPIILL
jgi:hypothetical protein